jgi:hypothetical protein
MKSHAPPERPNLLSALQNAARHASLPEPPAAAQASRWEWLRHWEFWLILVLGGFLRLWHLDVAQFTFANDQSDFMTLARGIVTVHALPVTGIVSSITTLNPPLSIYLVMPFALFTPSPLPAVIFIAVWNTCGVVLCYVFALRYFSRTMAAVGALLFATCGEAVDLSRFLWQQNFITPLLVLWGLTLYWGCVEGRRRWFVPHVTLLILGALLHPTVLLLAPVSLVGVLLAPTAPRRGEIGLAALIGLVLLGPTVLWEVVSSGSDIRLLADYALNSHAVINRDVLRVLRQAVGSPTFPQAGSFSPYAHVLPTSAYAQLWGLQSWLERVGILTYAAGYLVLSALVLWPAWVIVRAHYDPYADQTAMQRFAIFGRELWRGLRANATWRTYLLLWLWVTVPIVLLFRHSSPVFAHYLLILYPAVFLMAGLAIDRLLAAARAAAQSLASVLKIGAATLWSRAGQGVIVLVVGGLVAGQALLCSVYVSTLAAGQFDANAGYGYTMGEFLSADQTLAAVQQQEHATSVFISAPGQFYHDAIRYLIVGDHADRVSFYGDCLVLPPAQNGPALVVSTDPHSSAAALLPSLPNARYVSTLSLPGGDPFTVYRMAGALPALPDETATAPVMFHVDAGNGLRLDAASVDSAGQLRLRWTVLGSTATGKIPRWYASEERPLGQDGRLGQTATATAHCEPTRWMAGDTVFTWLKTPSTTTSAQQLSGATSASGSVGIAVLGYTSHLDMPTVGPIRLLSGRVTGDPPRLLPPERLAGQGVGTLTANGAFSLPVDALAHT